MGRLEKVKRVIDLIPIMKNIDDSQIKLLIVGKGSQENDLKEVIQYIRKPTSGTKFYNPVSDI